MATIFLYYFIDGAYSEVEIPQMAVRHDTAEKENQNAAGGNNKQTQVLYGLYSILTCISQGMCNWKDH